MAGNGKGRYWHNGYVPQKIVAKVKRTRLIRRAVLMALSAAVLIITLVLVSIGRGRSALVAEAAAEEALAGVHSYPLIVDAQNPLSRDFVPDNLVPLNSVPHGESVYLRADAAEQFVQMLDAMAAEGMAVIPVRGYVSYEEQSALIAAGVDKYIAEGYESYEAEWHAVDEYEAPGASEAQLGTTVDVSTELELVDKFSSTDQYGWLCRNAYRYGFVVRSNDKPWRLRYVGTETAERMHEMGCGLESYNFYVMQQNPDAQEELF